MGLVATSILTALEIDILFFVLYKLAWQRGAVPKPIDWTSFWPFFLPPGAVLLEVATTANYQKMGGYLLIAMIASAATLFYPPRFEEEHNSKEHANHEGSKR